MKKIAIVIIAALALSAPAQATEWALIFPPLVRGGPEGLVIEPDAPIGKWKVDFGGYRSQERCEEMRRDIGIPYVEGLAYGRKIPALTFAQVQILNVWHQDSKCVPVDGSWEP